MGYVSRKYKAEVFDNKTNQFRTVEGEVQIPDSVPEIYANSVACGQVRAMAVRGGETATRVEIDGVHIGWSG